MFHSLFWPSKIFYNRQGLGWLGCPGCGLLCTAPRLRLCGVACCSGPLSPPSLSPLSLLYLPPSPSLSPLSPSLSLPFFSLISLFLPPLPCHWVNQCSVNTCLVDWSGHQGCGGPMGLLYEIMYVGIWPSRANNSKGVENLKKCHNKTFVISTSCTYILSFVGLGLLFGLFNFLGLNWKIM